MVQCKGRKQSPKLIDQESSSGVRVPIRLLILEPLVMSKQMDQTANHQLSRAFRSGRMFSEKGIVEGKVSLVVLFHIAELREDCREVKEWGEVMVTRKNKVSGCQKIVIVRLYISSIDQRYDAM